MSSNALLPGHKSTASQALPAATYVLSLCQALNLTAAVVSVTIAALVGAKMAPNATWATVPYGFQFAAVAFLTYPAAALMRRFGRKAGFLLGALLLIAAGGVGYQAVVTARFTELIVAHGLLGAFVAFANFYRFAAVENLASELRPRGVSLVVAGGIAAAVTGPLVSIGLRDIGHYAPFSLCYAFFIVLGLATMGLIFLWRPVGIPVKTCVAAPAARSPLSAPVVVAMFASAAGYLIMNLLMVQASLVMETMCVAFRASTFAVQGHVIAMFAPSFITGAIISRIGFRNILLLGFLLLIAAAIVGMLNLGFEAMAVGLLLLGVGWNFSYVGGGALLANQLTEGNRHRFQAINDSAIAVCATVGAFAPSVLESTIGWRNTNLLCLCLCVGGCVLAWRVLSVQRPAVFNG
jgi:MFS family permease